jgi:hypothetical protein
MQLSPALAHLGLPQPQTPLTIMERQRQQMLQAQRAQQAQHGIPVSMPNVQGISPAQLDVYIQQHPQQAHRAVMHAQQQQQQQRQAQAAQQMQLSHSQEANKQPHTAEGAAALGSTGGNNKMFIYYTISEDRTGSQESVTRQRLSALGARRRKRKLQEVSYSSVREETNPMEGLLGGGYDHDRDRDGNRDRAGTGDAPKKRRNVNHGQKNPIYQ